MGKIYLATEAELISVADAIRAKKGTSAGLSFPTEWITAINSISGGTFAFILATFTSGDTVKATSSSGTELVGELVNGKMLFYVPESGTYTVKSYTGSTVAATATVSFTDSEKGTSKTVGVESYIYIIKNGVVQKAINRNIRTSNTVSTSSSGGVLTITPANNSQTTGASTTAKIDCTGKKLVVTGAYTSYKASATYCELTAWSDGTGSSESAVNSLRKTNRATIGTSAATYSIDVSSYGSCYLGIYFKLDGITCTFKCTNMYLANK